MTFLSIIGAFAVAFVAALVAFYATLRGLDNAGAWRHLELAAIIPMLITAVVAALAVGGCTLWVLLPASILTIQ